MSQPVDQHHTPVFYLKRWAGDDGKLSVARHIRGKIARSRHAPEYLGFEPHLYSYHEDFTANDPAEIETQFLRPIDEQGARIVSNMIAGRSLEKRDRVLWTQFLLALRARSPENVQKMRGEGEKALVAEMHSAQTDYERLRQNTDPTLAVDWLRVNRPGLIESVGVGQLPKIYSNPRSMQDVLSFDWHIVDFAKSSKPLLSSDRPCVYTDGLDKPDCVIALPMSPRHAFFAFRPNSNAQRLLISLSVSKLAAELNKSVVGQAADRAFGREAGDAPDAFFHRYLSPSKC